MGAAHGALFSPTYAQARRRFVQAAQAAGAAHHAYAIDAPCDEPLAIDVAILDAPAAPTLVVSSGVHGIEGFWGSAVQLALLQQLAAARAPRKLRYVLLHAVNPFGFAHLRRVNEHNVDLNRNFLTKADHYAGAPAGYAALDALLNPPTAPVRLEPFRLKALRHILRLGLPALKDAVAGGQYEFPCGLFFGGRAPSASMRIVQDHCDGWIAASRSIVHIDLHTGLGAFATPALLLNTTPAAEDYAWYAQTFGAEHIEPIAQSQRTAYRVSGMFGQWMQHRFNEREYRFVGAEFGTYGVLRVLAALRAENRAHHYCAADDAAYTRAKLALRECFCPLSTAWRNRTVEGALRIVDQAAQALARRAR